MNKFNVGDKVIIIGTCLDSTDKCGRTTDCPFLNKEGVIESITRNKIVCVKNFIGSCGFCSGFEIKNIKLIEKKIRIIREFGISKWCEKMYNNQTKEEV